MKRRKKERKVANEIFISLQISLKLNYATKNIIWRQKSNRSRPALKIVIRNVAFIWTWTLTKKY